LICFAYDGSREIVKGPTYARAIATSDSLNLAGNVLHSADTDGGIVEIGTHPEFKRTLKKIALGRSPPPDDGGGDTLSGRHPNAFTSYPNTSAVEGRQRPRRRVTLERQLERGNRRLM
jgi:hypothetical protein